VYADKVYFTTPDAHLLAFDAASGNMLWDVEIADSSVGYCSPASPLVVKGKVLVGVAFGDRGMVALSMPSTLPAANTSGAGMRFQNQVSQEAIPGRGTHGKRLAVQPG
jgi:hypothetical protein